MVQQASEVNRDLLECTVSRGCLDQQVLLGREENLVIRVSLVRVVQLAKLDQGVNVESLEREESWDLLVCLEPKVSQEHLVLMAQRAALDLLVHWAIKALLVCRECQVKEGSLAHLVQKETEELLVRKDQKAPREVMVQGV